MDPQFQQNNPYGYPQPGYPMQPPPQYAPVMTVKNWLLTMLLLAIPLVNIIMLFVWAFGSGENPNKQNYAKASLLMAAIVIGLYIAIFLLVIFLVAATANA